MKNKSSLEAFVTVTLQGKGSLRSRCATEAVLTEGDCRWDEVCELWVKFVNFKKSWSSEILRFLEFSRDPNLMKNWLERKFLKKSEIDKKLNEIFKNFFFEFSEIFIGLKLSYLKNLKFGFLNLGFSKKFTKIVFFFKKKTVFCNFLKIEMKIQFFRISEIQIS